MLDKPFYVSNLIVALGLILFLSAPLTTKLEAWHGPDRYHLGNLKQGSEKVLALKARVGLDGETVCTPALHGFDTSRILTRFVPMDTAVPTFYLQELIDAYNTYRSVTVLCARDLTWLSNLRPSDLLAINEALEPNGVLHR